MTTDAAAQHRLLVRYMLLSLAAAVVTIGLKSLAALVTGSVGFLSDALESVVNLVAAVVALLALRTAARPPDEEHQFGHGKAEYFSAAVEGGMIFLAAAAIVWTSVRRLLDPVPIEQAGIGLVLSTAASVLNGVVGVLLLRVGRRHRSITLEADGRHLLTDVLTSVGVLVGIAAVAITGWDRLDPIIALLVGVNILHTGYSLLRRSGSGLLDVALPPADADAIAEVMARYERDEGVSFHALRTRESGRHRFVSVHVLVPGAWTVQRAHDLLERFEADIAAVLSDVATFTHVEPVEDPTSYQDIELHRRRPPGGNGDGGDQPAS